MKMEHAIRAPAAGVVTELRSRSAPRSSSGAVLAVVAEEGSPDE